MLCAPLALAEREVESTGGRWFMRRVLPYRTQDGKVGGVVITFADVSNLKELQRQTAAAQKYAENIVDTVRERTSSRVRPCIINHRPERRSGRAECRGARATARRA